MPTFDEARIDDPAALAAHDTVLRTLAGAGARIRIEATDVEWPASLGQLSSVDRPRGVVVAGAEARLVRAVLEPVCPVPLVAWSLGGLPGWVGPLDLVVVLASDEAGQQSAALMATVDEAVRRGAQLWLAAPSDSVLVGRGERASVRIPTRTGDPLAAAVVVLEMFGRIGLGPAVNTVNAAEAADMVAEACSPFRDLSNNPAKDLACALGDAEPLIWGGSVLAGRAARRMAEAIRRCCGCHALAADASEVIAVMQHVAPRDVFADPFENGTKRREALVMLDDAESDDLSEAITREVISVATAMDVPIQRIASSHGSALDRYLTLLLHGLYAVAYLEVGLSDR
ncbi:hypothetical protein HMPREF1531_01734 [Propionibacterium sp. oral taxon 192 str. F0372]|uniref:SIS domain-containing protein n=1 Tax=Propionibacterium sp. oral taxon 192 TaxID=671222 RepID=UPI000352F3BF|nr:SIS domain-containing protein [Propionibacterium sp. oral taxon 192]EPH02428.1 hypothetical protein HMPREF1531_01734 [Propionibacterium sp. oral taxon 192 str. F0372]